jgi:hypothetical protein
MGLTATGFLLLRDLLDKDCLAVSQLVALYALAVAIPALAVVTVEIYTAPETKEALGRSFNFVFWVGNIGLVCLCIGVCAITWHASVIAALLFALSAIVVMLCNFLMWHKG